METVALVAPVTALEFLRDEFLLTGEGPVLSVYSLQPRPKVCVSLSVLQHHRIHGIRPRRQAAESAQSSAAGKKHANNSTTVPVDYDLVVFGGKSVRLLRLHRDHKDEEHLRLELLGPLVELQDWALDVRWLSTDSPSLLCVAAAHNSVLLLDVTKGQMVVQRSCQEGCLLYSALLLVHESWSDTVVVGGTVFNQLILWKPAGGGESSTSEDKAPVERRLLGHSGVIFSISYVQEDGYLASASDDRSVRVWSVGAVGGAGGKCGDLNPACLRVLYGHQARVFSVHLSPGRVFSAGEDGACLVWAGDGSVVRTLKGHRAGGVRALAVSDGTAEEERWVATGGADGGVRLWRVKWGGEEESTEHAKTEKLTDLKFPGDGLPKIVCTVGEEPENTSWGQIKFVVCTDKGLVSQWHDGKWQVIWQGPPDFQSYCVMETVAVTVKESTAKVCLCAVGNLSGSLRVFPTSHPDCGILLTAGTGKIHSLVWLKGEEGAYLLASGAEGLVYRWLVEVNPKGSSSLVIGVKPLPSFLLPPCAKRWLTAAVLVPSTSLGTLSVCGDRRGSLIVFQERGALKEGEEEEGRTESLLVDRKQSAEGNSRDSEGESAAVQPPILQPPSCLFGVHGKQGVTSVREHRGLLYSTGRDGCVRVFRVKLGEHEGRAENRAGPQLEVLRVQRACKGMEWLERILFLEPEASEEEKGREARETKVGFSGGKGREARFVIVGFHAVHFVVWDPVRQQRLLAVPCGGGHRSWSLWPSHEGLWQGHGAVVFIKQGAVLSSQPPGQAPGSTGGAGMTGGWGLREGVHGRGIGCVCRLGRIEEPENECQESFAANEGKVDKGGRQWDVVATGGEDTCLSVLAVNPTTGSVKVLSVITDHISSVRTVTACSAAGGGSPSGTLAALLVSAGGRAQMQCYRLLVSWDAQRLAPSCQVVQIAGHRLDAEWERKRNRHKTVKMDPETRYMCVTVVDETADSVLVSVSCSDGAIRLFSISEAKRRIDLLWETFYHQRCVLSNATCSLEDDKGHRYKLLFSAATDGQIAVWHLTDACFSTHNSSGATTPPIPCLNIPAHQSGVNSLAVWAENLGQQEGGCLVTVASGGDDGQLTVSTVRVQYPDAGSIGGSRGFSQTSEVQLGGANRPQLRLHSQARVPLAHAAPLTSLKLLSPGLVVTTSSDQRVCLWQVSGTGLSHSGALCSHVADAAGLAVWEEEGGDGTARIKSEDELADWEGRESGCQGETADGASGGGEVSQEGEPPETGRRIRDQERGGEVTNQTESDSRRKSETNTETHLKDGWVLVCGQGLQLLRVQNLNTDAEIGRDKRGEERANLLRVTL